MNNSDNKDEKKQVSVEVLVVKREEISPEFFDNLVSFQHGNRAECDAAWEAMKQKAERPIRKHEMNLLEED